MKTFWNIGAWALAAAAAAGGAAAKTTTTSTEAAVTTPEVIKSFLSDGSVTTYTKFPTTTTDASGASATGNSSAVGENTCTSGNYTKEPFCSPGSGDQWVKGHTYEVTWDADYYTDADEVNVALLYGSDGSDSELVTQSGSLSSHAGSWFVKVEKSWLDGNDTQSVYLKIVPIQGSSMSSTSDYFKLAKTDDPDKKSREEQAEREAKRNLKAAIATPLIIVGVIAVLALYFYLRRRGAKVPVYHVGRSKGYATGRSRQERAAGKRAATYTDDNDGEYELDSYRDLDAPPTRRPYRDDPGRRDD